MVDLPLSFFLVWQPSSKDEIQIVKEPGMLICIIIANETTE